MIKAVIFDFFGVIVNDALQVICDELAARDPKACVEVRDIIKAANHGLMEPAESNRRIAELLGISIEEFRSRKTNGEMRNQALLDCIKQLRGRYKTAVLSNATVGSLERRFSPAELRELFDEQVVSADIGYMKPEPEAYTVAAQRLGVEPSECVFTDDRDVFCQAARATGMQAIHYRDFAQFKGELECILDEGKAQSL